MSYNKRLHLRQNIDAIKIAFTLGKEHRKATPQEIEPLALYAGFGKIKAILSPVDKPKQLTKSEKELFPLIKELHDVLKENSPSSQVYKAISIS